MGSFIDSGRRLRACYRGQRIGHMPICSPISWQPTADIDRERPGGWRADPEFIEVARLVQEHCDPLPLLGPVPPPKTFAPLSYQRFLEAPMEYVETLPEERLTPTRTRYTTVLHAPKGDLTWAHDIEEGKETSWDTIKPVNGLEDVERLLSVPWRFDPPPPAAYAAHRQNRAAMGEGAIGGSNVNSMVAMLCGIMPYEQMLEWLLCEEQTIRLLADTWLQRTRRIVNYLLDQGVGPVWHFNGVERACPPMMSHKQWEQWVEPYDGAVMRLIKRRDPAAVIHVHCHGKVGTMLRSFVEMGVDSTDPVEPPPQGDILLAEARRIVGDRMVLYGNVEFVYMERLPPNQIEELVRRGIADAGPLRMVLYPSATPHERHTPQLLANARRFIEAGLKHG